MESFYKKKKKPILWPQAKPTESELSFQKFLQSFLFFQKACVMRVWGQKVVRKNPVFLAVVLGYGQGMTHVEKMMYWVWGVLLLKCSWEAKWRQARVCSEAFFWMSMKRARSGRQNCWLVY